MPDDGRDDFQTYRPRVYIVAPVRQRLAGHYEVPGDGRRSPVAPKARIIPFPGHRRVGEVRRLALQMRQLSYRRGEAHLRHKLQQKADALTAAQRRDVKKRMSFKETRPDRALDRTA
jgi:Family of unknown function (DUF6074)